MTAMLFTLPRQRAMDANGNPAGGAKAYFYEVGTTTDLTVYQDRARTIPHAQPVVADSAGWFPPIYPPDGYYKLTLKNSLGVDIWSTVDDQAGPLSVTGSSSGGGGDIAARLVTVGSVLLWYTNTPPSGWLECNGQAVSRTAYPQLFALWGTRFGAGDGSTTFNVLDMRGQFPRGWAHGSATDPDAASRTDRGDGTTGDNIGTKQGAKVGPLGLSATSSTSVTTTITGGPYAIKSGAANTSSGSGTFNISGEGTPTAASSATTTTTVTSSTAGSETRPTNIAAMFCVLASPAEASSASLGTLGLQYRFDTTTTNSNPGDGYVRFNNASYNAVTAIYINKSDAAGAYLGSYIGTWDDSTSVTKGELQILRVGAPEQVAIFQITDVLVDHVSYWEVPVLHVQHSGTAFATTNNVAIGFSRSGDKGQAGTPGGGSVNKYATNVGDGAARTYTITHGLGTYDVDVVVYRNSAPRDTIGCDVARSSINAITLTFDAAPTTAELRCVVMG